MPTDMSKYPGNWKDIRNQILRRAGGRGEDPRTFAKCEVCGAQNYSVGIRRRDNGGFHAMMLNETYADALQSKAELGEILEALGDGHLKLIIIVLTIAHWNDPHPANCDPDNLKAVCQKCHNSHDAQLRADRRRNRINWRTA